MFYYLYEIKNVLTGMIYVGVHKTANMEDGYMGSGKVLMQSIKKYGVTNFTKTVLETFSSSEDMYARERSIVDDAFIARKDTYNLRRGGTGGFGKYHTDRAVAKNAQLTNIRRDEYARNPKQCKQCTSTIPYRGHKHKKFCSKSCSQTYNNLRRVLSDKIKSAIATKMKGVPKSKEHRENISASRRKNTGW